eukprot:CAMPEP_0184692558 /NCGR_PEP_ID=MMETSP0313-20130426/989_1 /TAXON_ID=2792 /ORGANISM="Porphyridium aerugineum, Strain SAG 1380-2" /LENGTH=546 /DNA_ID=CAMNT_0027150395 /DNA_START=351 /DNA_END=1991 /DNA_ORIENTATION=-
MDAQDIDILDDLHVEELMLAPDDALATQHVTIWNRVECRKVAGNAAPLRRNVHKYLEAHPECEIYDGQDKFNMGIGQVDPKTGRVINLENEHVAIWHTVEKRKITGNAAPLRKNLEAYLKRNVDCEVYAGQDKSAGNGEGPLKPNLSSKLFESSTSGNASRKNSISEGDAHSNGASPLSGRKGSQAKAAKKDASPLTGHRPLQPMMQSAFVQVGMPVTTGIRTQTAPINNPQASSLLQQKHQQHAAELEQQQQQQYQQQQQQQQHQHQHQHQYQQLQQPMLHSSALVGRPPAMPSNMHMDPAAQQFHQLRQMQQYATAGMHHPQQIHFQLSGMSNQHSMHPPGVANSSATHFIGSSSQMRMMNQPLDYSTPNSDVLGRKDDSLHGANMFPPEFSSSIKNSFPMSTSMEFYRYVSPETSDVTGADPIDVTAQNHAVKRSVSFAQSPVLLDSTQLPGFSFLNRMSPLPMSMDDFRDVAGGTGTLGTSLLGTSFLDNGGMGIQTPSELGLFLGGASLSKSLDKYKSGFGNGYIGSSAEMMEFNPGSFLQ